MGWRPASCAVGMLYGSNTVQRWLDARSLVRELEGREEERQTMPQHLQCCCCGQEGSVVWFDTHVYNTNRSCINLALYLYLWNVKDKSYSGRRNFRSEYLNQYSQFILILCTQFINENFIFPCSILNRKVLKNFNSNYYKKKSFRGIRCKSNSMIRNKSLKYVLISYDSESGGGLLWKRRTNVKTS